MAIITVHDSQICRSYRNYVCSSTTFTVLFLRILAFLPPLLIIFYDGTFLQEVEEKYKIPYINFTYELFTEIHTSQRVYAWTTVSKAPFPHSFLAPSVASSEQHDVDNDGRMDKLQLTFTYLPFNSPVLQVDLLVFFDIRFKNYPRFRLSSLAHLHTTTIGSSSNLVTWIGSLRLVQQMPINLLDSSLRREQDPTLVDQSSVSSMVQTNNLRPVRTAFVLEQVSATTNANSSDFTLSATIHYPLYFNVLHYKSLLNKVKTFLVEFIALYIPCHIAVTYTIDSLLKSAVLSSLLSPMKRSKMLKKEE